MMTFFIRSTRLRDTEHTPQALLQLVRGFEYSEIHLCALRQGITSTEAHRTGRVMLTIMTSGQLEHVQLAGSHT